MTTFPTIRVVRQGVTMLALALGAAAPLPMWAADGDKAVDLGASVLSASKIREGLFPKQEAECEELEKVGQRCMGFKPATVRYSLPSANFKVGSAELPDLLRKQLDKFAEVLRAKKGSNKVIRIEGHADASGTDEVNAALSLRRAEAVKAYLVAKGADAAMLEPVGLGSKAPKLPDNPNAAENRRVEIGRAVAQ